LISDADPKVEAVENHVNDDPEGQDVFEDHCRTFLSRLHPTNRRNPGRLPHAHASTAIALQRQQSFWRSRRSVSLDH
jgi:hypothetical protein